MTEPTLPGIAPRDREQGEEAELLGPGLIHEMRHPLLGIKAGLELIARRMGRRVTELDDWQMVSTQVARLEELFRSYQQLFAPEPATLSRFAVEGIVQRGVDLVAWRVRRLGTRFEWSWDGAQHGYGSPNALLHAIVNLLVNAVDAVEEAGGAGRVAVRVLRDPLEVRVSDEGAGIAQEHRVLLFQPRFTTKAPGRGTGLGLHIARQGMQRTGGDVRLVGPGEPHRLPWAVTEFAVQLGKG
jgi:signal transduction histidine kinase